MFGKAAPKKCLPRTTKRYQKITRTYRKRGANGFVLTFCLVTFGKSPRYLLQCVNLVEYVLRLPSKKTIVVKVETIKGSLKSEDEAKPQL